MSDGTSALASAAAASTAPVNSEMPFRWAADVPSSFPPAFVAFLAANDVHPANYETADVPRYVRLSPRAPATLDAAALGAQLGAACAPVAWLPGFFSLPADVKIAGCDAYRRGHLYGVDAASGAAVAALAPQPGDHVLDLCCAPGAKLCCLADAMGLQGTLTGVDVSEERLAACRTLCLKYGIENARLVRADGREFCEPPPARVAEIVDGGGEASAPRAKRARAERPGAFYEGAALRGAPTPAPAAGGYDKVLVDAECTHDGSIKHLAKFAQWGWDTFERRVMQPERLATLRALQSALLRNGFARLRPGGTLVYATCSFARAQNEEVVEELLRAEPSAALLPIRTLDDAPCRRGAFLPHTLRFEPRVSRTSALFVARIGKRPHPEAE